MKINKNSCNGKIRYQSEEQAVKAANNHNYKYGEHPCEPYPCKKCLGWHIGGIWNWKDLKNDEKT